MDEKIVHRALAKLSEQLWGNPIGACSSPKTLFDQPELRPEIV